LCISHCAYSQNLVENPDFELYGVMPCGWCSITDFTNALSGWTSASQATPDVFSTLINSSCTNFLPHSTNTSSNGWQSTHSGDIFSGFYTYVNGSPNYREYIQGHLTQPLIPGESYKVSMYVSLGDNSQMATNNLGVGFYTAISTFPFLTEIGTTPEINFTNVISDTTSWTFLCDTIMATAAWNYIIIGNYFSDANTSILNFNPGGFWDRTYYYCDDVSVEQINLVPAAMFSADNHICPGTCTNFTNLSNNATSYLWTFNGAVPPLSTDVDPQNICYNIPGTYPVTLIATSATGSDTLTLNNFITVYPQPAPQGISQSGDTLFANQGATSYQWYYNSNIISGATDYFYVATQSGDYNVVATDENDCEVEAVINDVLANTQSPVGSWELAIYPNPVADKFRIQKSQVTSGAAVEITVYNVIGEKIMDASPLSFGEGPGGEATWTVDCQPLRSGLYYLELKADEKIFRSKFVKQ